MHSLTAMLTAKQTGALMNALVMLGAATPPGGVLTDAYLRTVDPAILTRAGALCGPRTSLLCSTFAGAAAAAPAPVAPRQGVDAQGATLDAQIAAGNAWAGDGRDAPPAPLAPVAAAVAAAHPVTPGAATAGALFGVAGDLPVATLPGGKPLDRHYLFRADQVLPLLRAWRAGLHVWLYGPPGTGKTTTVREIAARTGRPFFRINFADGVDRGDLIGQDTLTEGNITFRAGALLAALQVPYSIILLDEPSVARPEDLIALHPILDGSGAAVIPQTGGRITVAEGVSIVVANNTRGDADKSGMFAGLRPQSEALRDRFGVFIEVPHLTIAQESRLLRKRVPSLDKPTSIALATVVHASRELARKEEFPQAAISHRQALAWALLMREGATARAAFDSAVAARHESEVAEALAALYEKNFVPDANAPAPEGDDKGGDDDA